MKTANVQRKARKRPTPYEAAVKVGLIGCFDGPADLAQNYRKYIRRAVRAKHTR